MKSPLSLLAALAALGALACQGDPLNAPMHPGDQASLAAGGPKKAKPMITNVVLSSTTLNIGGPAVNYTVTIQNPGTTDATGLSIEGRVEQGSSSRAAGTVDVECGAGTGVVHPGTCTVALTAVALNSSAGTGTLMTGNAKLTVLLNQSDGTTTTLLDSRSMKVTLAGAVSGAVSITDLVLDFSSLTITTGEGTAPGTYTVTINNPTGVNQSLVLIQGYIKQGDNFAGAGGTNVRCTQNTSGIAPPGSCTFSFTASAFNSSPPGPFPLVAGPAVFRLELLQYDGFNTVLRDFREVNITLVDP